MLQESQCKQGPQCKQMNTYDTFAPLLHIPTHQILYRYLGQLNHNMQSPIGHLPREEKHPISLPDRHPLVPKLLPGTPPETSAWQIVCLAAWCLEILPPLYLQLRPSWPVLLTMLLHMQVCSSTMLTPRQTPVAIPIESSSSFVPRWGPGSALSHTPDSTRVRMIYGDTQCSYMKYKGWCSNVQEYGLMWAEKAITFYTCSTM